MKDRVTLFKEIVKDMADLYEKKNQNYGNSFSNLYNKLGPVAGLVPLHNKLDRATNLVTGGKNNFESLEDTFKDLACYAIMNLIEIKMNDNSKQNINLIGDTLNPELLRDFHTPLDLIKRNLNYADFDLSYTSPCSQCIRRTSINGCDGCSHNIQVTCATDAFKNI